jgi:hypothetical protein
MVSLPMPPVQAVGEVVAGDLVVPLPPIASSIVDLEGDGDVAVAGQTVVLDADRAEMAFAQVDDLVAALQDRSMVSWPPASQMHSRYSLSVVNL